MIHPVLNVHRLLTGTIAIVALLSWGIRVLLWSPIARVAASQEYVAEPQER